MYDEFDHKEENGGNNYNGGSDPVRPVGEQPGENFQNERQGEEENVNFTLSRGEEPQAEESAPHTEMTSPVEQNQERSGFYHYTYEKEPEAEPAPEMHQNPSEERHYREPKAPRQRGKKPFWKSVAVCASLALVFGVVASAAFQVTDYVGGKIAPQETESKIGTTDTVAPADTTQGGSNSDTMVPVSTSTDIAQVAKNAMPSIVAITNKGVQEVQSMFFGQSYTQETESAGSGVIVSKNDTELLIATNNHVVEGAEELSVCFTVDTENPEDAVIKAQIKGTDPDHDLAVVAVQLSDIPDTIKDQIKVAQIGDSDSLEVGQQVVAIGNALGYGQSVTVGYVSALNREVTVDDVTNSLIQTDAAINFGNSGGALLNTAGELIGINSVKAAASGVEGMGYAIPMSTAQPILNDLMNRTTRTKVEDTEKGYLGVVPRDVSEEAKEVYSMPAGAFIYEVTEGSAADKAGIAKGDIITKVDGVSISSREDLFTRMDYYKAGETIDFVVATAQNGEYVERTVSVTLGEKPAEDTTTSEQKQQQQYPGENGSGQEQYEQYGENPFEQLIP